MNYCKYLRWVEDQDADYYECALGLETSSDWCDDVVGEKSECSKFNPIPYPTLTSVDKTSRVRR